MTHRPCQPVLVLVATISLIGLATMSRAENAPKEKVTFQDQVLPIFRSSCVNCHNPDAKKAGLDVTSVQAILAGGSDGKVATPGDADGSLLYRVLAHTEEPYMPKGGGKFQDKQLAVVKAWIDGGMLDNSASVAVVGQASSLAIAQSAFTRPEGPPPMPMVQLSREPLVHSTHPGPLLSMAASPWAPLVAVGSQRQVLLFNSDSLELVGVLPFADGLPLVLKFSRNGTLLLAAGGEGARQGKVVIYNITDGKRVAEVGGEFDSVMAADISPDQSLVALGGPSKVLKVFNIRNPSQPVYTIKKHTDWLTAIAFSPDGKLLASGDRSGNLYIFEASNGGELYTLRGHKDAITQVVFREDGNVIASSSQDGTVKLWDAHSGESLKSITANPGGSLDVAVDHEGRLASVGRDKQVRLFSREGVPGKSLLAFNDIALHAAFTHDNQRLICGDFTGQVRVYDTATGSQVGQLDSNPSATRPATTPAKAGAPAPGTVPSPLR